VQGRNLLGESGPCEGRQRRGGFESTVLALKAKNEIYKITQCRFHLFYVEVKCTEVPQCGKRLGVRHVASPVNADKCSG